MTAPSKTAPLRPSLTHAGIYVRDLAMMTRFYTQIMNLHVSDRGHGFSMPVNIVFLTADPTKHHQFILAEGRKDDGPSTINQLSFKVANLDELRTMYLRVKGENVNRLRGINHGNAWSVYFEDPEGNTIEIYMDTPWYVSQPHGDALDLSLSNDEIFKQTETMCMKDEHFMPVREWETKMRRDLGLVAG
ncbi:MAG: VOC family protein [Burkholderiales bacterium]